VVARGGRRGRPRGTARRARSAARAASRARTGCVRFCGTELWLLNRREGGWSAWGVLCDGWDDLFRRFAVTITEHSTNEYGAYWIAVPESP
jgi:hypothetical protein